MARLNREFFLQDTVAAAQALLGCYLVRVDGGETIVCRITETEAYVGAVDKAGTRIGIDYAQEAVDFPWRFWLDE